MLDLSCSVEYFDRVGHPWVVAWNHEKTGGVATGFCHDIYVLVSIKSGSLLDRL
jgi:hypothetical protein